MDEAKVRAIVAAVFALEEAIKELGEVPSGHLYASLMGKLSLSQYESLLGMVLKRGRVRQEPSHLLVWVGEGR